MTDTVFTRQRFRFGQPIFWLNAEQQRIAWQMCDDARSDDLKGSGEVAVTVWV